MTLTWLNSLIASERDERAACIYLSGVSSLATKVLSESAQRFSQLLDIMKYFPRHHHDLVDEAQCASAPVSR